MSNEFYRSRVVSENIDTKLKAFDLLAIFVDDPSTLASSGYKTLEEATTSIIKKSKKAINDRIEAYEKKHPCS